MRVVRELLDKAEDQMRRRYFEGWLKALNDPEGTRQRAGLIIECFAAIRGELTDAES